MLMLNVSLLATASGRPEAMLLTEILLGAVILGLLLFVVGPAVWSSKKSRREAAVIVLDRLLNRSH